MRAELSWLAAQLLRWHLDEVSLEISDWLQSLWRAVHQDGEALDILVQPRRDKRAAEQFIRK